MHHWWKSCYLLLVCLLTFTSTELFAEQQLLPKLRVVTESFPPYSFKNEQGKIDGAVTLVVQALLKKGGLPTDIEIMPWARAYSTALVEPNVLIYSIVRIPEREALFYWLAPVTAINIGVYTMPNTKSAELTDLTKLDHMTIGVMRGSSSIEFFKSFRNIENKNLLEMASFNQLYKMLQYRRINFALAPELLIKYLDMKYHTPVDLRPIPIYKLPLQQQSTMYIGLSKKSSPAVVKRFQQAIAEMQQQGDIRTIVDQYKHTLTKTP